MSLRRNALVLVGVAAIAVGAVGTAGGTPSMGVTAETARGPVVDRPLRLNVSLDPSTKLKLKATGPVEVAVQRIVAVPGATFGWHSHPGPTVVTVLRGTLTLYHAEDCSEGTDYGPGTSFSNLPDEVHLARNEGSEELVAYAFYFVAVESPPVALRIDQPLPAPGCPQ